MPSAAFVHYQTSGRFTMSQTIETIALIWVVLIIAYGTIALALLPVLWIVRQFRTDRRSVNRTARWDILLKWARVSG
jgi:uncharacterized membrane protein YdfJ with MMPL/SSD domain